MAAQTQGEPLLSTFQKHVEDMRNLIHCKICIKPLYEPYMLGCGHTYCYSCLTSWFAGGPNGEHRRREKNCPDCRAEVIVQPAPNYLLRDLVHMFIGRAELLPEDETTEEHTQAKDEEAGLLTADRGGTGLFKGVFHPRRPFRGGRTLGNERLVDTIRAAINQRLPLHDPHDNVDRCPECHWELEGGHCNQCYWPYGDSDGEDLSDNLDEEATIDTQSVAISWEVDDDIDPTDQELEYDDPLRPPGDYGSENYSSETESFLPTAVTGEYHNSNRSLNLHHVDVDVDDDDDEDEDEDEVPRAHYNESGRSSTRYDETEEDVDESDTGESEMEGFIDNSAREDDDDDDSSDESGVEGSTPSQQNVHGRISISSQSGNDSDRTPGQPGSYMSSSDDESSEDESRTTPVPRSRPSRSTRIVLDDSEEEGLDFDTAQGGGGKESDARAIPPQSAATRRSHLNTQRVRRGNLNDDGGRRLLSPVPPRPSVPYRRGGFDNDVGRHHPYPPQITRRGRPMRSAVAG